APPGRLTITTGWPSCSPIDVAMARATESVAPPGGYGTIHCSARSGNCAARAGRPSPIPEAPASMPCSKVRRCMVFSLFGQVGPRGARMLRRHRRDRRIAQLALDQRRARLRAGPHILAAGVGERLIVPGGEVALQAALLHQAAARLAM